MKKLKRLIKLTFMGVAMGLILSYGVTEFLLYKLKEERHKYYMAENDIKTLNDTYSLCLGLLMTTRAQRDHKTCEHIRQLMLEKAQGVEAELKYNEFVKKYLD